MADPAEPKHVRSFGRAQSLLVAHALAYFAGMNAALARALPFELRGGVNQDAASSDSRLHHLFDRGLSTLTAEPAEGL